MLSNELRQAKILQNYYIVNEIKLGKV